MEAVIRRPLAEDIPGLWKLMHGLATYEHYLDSFNITPEVVLEKGFLKSPPDFYSFIAESEGKVAGMIIYYLLPYTAINRPSMYIKELFVDEKFRGLKIGELLMKAVSAEARDLNCFSIKWTVAPWNEDGMRFYERLGANQNTEWINYELSEEDFSTLILSE